MKTLSIFFLALFTVIAANTFSQVTTGTVKAKQIKQDTIKTHRIFIDAKGGIHDHGGTKLGYIDKNNIAWNNKGQKIYFIDKSGNVFDGKGKKLGKANKNGTFYNLQGASVIKTKDKDQQMCEILDSKGHMLGTVHKNYKLHSCASHCFFLDEKNKKKN
ncbi:5-fold beta-flower protein [Pedobacter sp. P351]|uniref:5-fold beta-flower protein n=1 Tax=Pedobacter superstes TaxID=3133441 RepID=UPI0030AAA020